MVALITHINIISFDRKSPGGQNGEFALQCHAPIWSKMHFKYIISHREDQYRLYIHQAFLPSHSFSSVFTEMKNPCTQVKQQACIFFHPSLVRIPAGRSHLATSHRQAHASQVREITMAQKLGQLHTSGDRLCYGTCTQQLLEMCALPIPPTWYQHCMSKIPR